MISARCPLPAPAGPVTAVVLAVVLAAALLTGCGGGASETSLGEPSAAGLGGTPVAAEPSTDTSGRPAPDPTACGDVTPIIAALAGSEMTSVTVVGQCTSVVIATSLPDTGSVLANQLCERAAKVAYTGEVTAISVLGASKRELSVGIQGAPCLAEP